MNIDDIKDFFNEHALSWDEQLKINYQVMDEILKTIDIKPGEKILDVACGTGVMFPFYLKAKAGSITGVDISPNMIEIAKNKFKNNNVSLICADAENYNFNKNFDKCVIFNALPHFINLDKLFNNMAKHLNPGGTIVIAHDKSRDEINKRHKKKANSVSKELLSLDELEKIMNKYFKVAEKISDEKFIIKAIVK